ncbi:MAG TPA: hypothetical protein V6D48_22175, partial [Oculatellaceae cyanobacterium]
QRSPQPTNLPKASLKSLFSAAFAQSYRGIVNVRNWKQQQSVIAIAGDKPGEWQFFTFPTWEDARIAVNAARSQGKAAVFYSGACPPLPPEF